jgi:hypothetical protein
MAFVTRCLEKRIHCRIRRVQIGHGREEKNLENKAYTVVNNEKTLARSPLPK